MYYIYIITGDKPAGNGLLEYQFFLQKLANVHVQGAAKSNRENTKSDGENKFDQ